MLSHYCRHMPYNDSPAVVPRSRMGNICFTLITSFPLQPNPIDLTSTPRSASPVPPSPPLEKATAPLLPPRTDRALRGRSSSSATNAGDHLSCPETRPCPPPSSGGRRRVQILADTTDGGGGLLGNVDSQRRYAAHLHAQANASCESFIKTLKREEIRTNWYKNLEHLRANIEIFIEQYYNQQRLHSALGYRSPEEFELQAQCQSGAADSKGATITFVAALVQSSTGMLEQGTQRRPPLQTSSPLEKSTEQLHEQ